MGILEEQPVSLGLKAVDLKSSSVKQYASCSLMTSGLVSWFCFSVTKQIWIETAETEFLFW